MLRKQILYIGNQLSKHGYSPSTAETLGADLEIEGYEIYYASNKLNPFFRLFDMIFTIIKLRFKVGLVLIDTYSTSAFYYAWICAEICKYFRMKYVPILHGGNLPNRIERTPFASKRLFSNSYINVAVSGYLQNSLIKKGYNNIVISNSININNYKFQSREVKNCNILWVRSFHEIYNPQLAILAVSKLINKYPVITLTMVGPDKDGSLEKCKNYATELGISSHVFFTGKLSKSEWIEVSKKCYVFINTTNFDNLPVSLIEAMALGMPIISTNVGGIKFLLSNNVNGILVNVNNINELCNAISSVFDDANLANRLSKNARITAENYDWQVVKKDWIRLLDNIK